MYEKMAKNVWRFFARPYLTAWSSTSKCPKTAKQPLLEFEALKKMVESDTTLDKGIFPYMQSVLTKAELVEALDKYKKSLSYWPRIGKYHV